MKDIFLCLMMNLKNHGEIKAAMMDETYASIRFENNGKEYSVSVHARDIEEVKSDD